MQLPGFLPLLDSSLLVALFFFSLTEPFFYEGLKEAAGPAQQAPLFFAEGWVRKDLSRIGDGFFEESSPVLLALGRDNTAHVGIFGQDYTVVSVVFNHPFFTDSALQAA